MVDHLKKKKETADTGLSLDRLLPNAGGSMFCLARMAMMRSTEIYDGCKPLIDHLPLDKSTTIALNEIATGKVVFAGEYHV